jgi:hypothetical protein
MTLWSRPTTTWRLSCRKPATKVAHWPTSCDRSPGGRLQQYGCPLSAGTKARRCSAVFRERRCGWSRTTKLPGGI